MLLLSSLESLYRIIQDRWHCPAFEYIDKKLNFHIRIPSKPNADDEYNDINEKISWAQTQQFGGQSTCNNNYMYDRTWDLRQLSPSIATLDNDNNKQEFTVLQFNTLAQGLSSGPLSVVTPPFDAESQDENFYGGFTALENPDIVLNFDLRKWRLIEILLKQNINYDIIALQEVDQFPNFIDPILQRAGYQSLFVPKPNAPGVRMGWYSDGCALCWNPSKLELQNEQRLHYDCSPQVFIIATFKVLAAATTTTTATTAKDQYLVVAVTHLKAKESYGNEKIRQQQAHELLHHVNKAVSKVVADNHVCNQIILGDFNANPSEPAIKDELLKEYLSAYELSSLPYTTWKTRGSQTTRRVIDYIFHDKKLQCTHTLSVPESLPAPYLPSLQHPSDHLHIAAKFRL